MSNSPMFQAREQCEVVLAPKRARHRAEKGARQASRPGGGRRAERGPECRPQEKAARATGAKDNVDTLASEITTRENTEYEKATRAPTRTSGATPSNMPIIPQLDQESNKLRSDFHSPKVWRNIVFQESALAKHKKTSQAIVPSLVSSLIYQTRSTSTFLVGFLIHRVHGTQTEI